MILLPVSSYARELSDDGIVTTQDAHFVEVLAQANASVSSVAQTENLASAVSLGPLESRLLEMLNQTRVERGLSPLQLEPRLVALARGRSADMVERDYFAHVTPEGIMVFTLMDRERIPYQLAGENLARNNYPPAKSPEIAHEGFMNSPLHAENELDPTFNRIGIGSAVAANGLIYFTELFAAMQ